MPARCNAAGIEPIATPPLPTRVRGLVEMLAEYQRLAAAAAWHGTRADGVRALTANPLVGQIDLAERLYGELAAAHRAYLPRAAGGVTRVCSLLPSATEIVADLGMIDSLVGVSNECRWPPEVVGLPIVTSARLDPAQLTSLEIDRRVRDAVSDGRSLYTVDAELIDTLEPDIIVTQDLCAVCAVSSGDLRSICPVDARMVSLDPRTLAEVADTVGVLAAALGIAGAERPLIERMWETIAEVEQAVAGLPPGGGSFWPSGSTRRSAPGTGCPR